MEKWLWHQSVERMAISFVIEIVDSINLEYVKLINCKIVIQSCWKQLMALMDGCISQHLMLNIINRVQPITGAATRAGILEHNPLLLPQQHELES